MLARKLTRIVTRCRSTRRVHRTLNTAAFEKAETKGSNLSVASFPVEFGCLIDLKVPSIDLATAVLLSVEFGAAIAGPAVDTPDLKATADVPVAKNVTIGTGNRSGCGVRC